MLSYLNPSPLFFIVTIMFGVLVHDMNIDKATKVAFTPPAALASTAAANTVDSMMSKSEHTHVERAALNAYGSSVPKTQPPRDDDRRYIQNKKQSVGGNDDHSHVWPSV
jgi:hypothetical protein